MRRYRLISATLKYTQLRESKIYSAEGKKLEDIVLSLLDTHLGQNHHIYQDNFYNSVRLALTLLDRNARVCSTTWANRGIPHD